MERKKFRVSSLIAAAMVGGVALTTWLLLRQSRVPTTQIVRNDIVSGQNGKRYRRVVRIDRSPAMGTYTTMATFTDMATGGVGKAVYIQLDEPLPNAPLSAFVRTVSGLVWRWGIPFRRNPPIETPLMSLPQPIEPGQSWKVRIVPIPNGVYTEGSGAHPPGAGLYLYASQLMPGRKSEIFYGKGAPW